MPDDQAVEISFEPQFDEYCAVRRMNARFMGMDAVRWTMLCVMSIIIVGISLYELLKNDNHYVLILPGGVLGIALVAIPLNRLDMWRQWRAEVRGVTVQVTFSDEGVRQRFRTAEALRYWEAFSHYRESDALFLLFSPDGDCLYLPKRVLSPDDTERVRNLLHRHVRVTRPQRREPRGFPVAPEWRDAEA